MTAGRGSSAVDRRVDRRSVDRRAQGGFTLVELMVALLISVVIVGAVSAALVTALRGVDVAEDTTTSSRSAFQTNARFARDIANARTADGTNPIGRGQAGCGGDGSSVLRSVRSDGGTVQVVSYSISGDSTLERRTCEGPTLAAALAAAGGSTDVVPDLGSGVDPVTVVCREYPDADPAPATAEGDQKCRMVTMTVRTRTGYVFTVEGNRDPVSLNLPPVPTTIKQCTLVAVADTWITSYDTDQRSGPDFHLNVFTRSRGGGDYGSLVSFVKMDLLGPCTGTNEPPYLPGGQRLTSAQLQLWMLRWGPSWGCTNPTTHEVRVLDGVPANRQIDGPQWDENNVTWDSRPEPKAAAADTVSLFEADRDVGQYSVDVLAATQRWYAGPDRGGWVNHGFQIDRSGFGACDSEEDGGWWWGSRENSDPRVWPRLVVTWQ